VAQSGGILTRNWFDLLNLGLRIAPAAGTDYPYLDHPGAVRNYVHLPRAASGEGFTVDGWFAGLEAGRTFVTSGPLLSFSINGAEMGEEIRVAAGEPLRITARASLLPDLDRLERLELIEQGEALASQTAAAPGVGPAAAASSDYTLVLDHCATANRSTWFVVRADGSRTVLHDLSLTQTGAISAVSAPIYVVDGDERTWKREAVAGIVDRLVSALDGLQGTSLESAAEHEWWETGPVWQRTWARQIAARSDRIDAARSRLRELGEQAGRE